MMMANVALDNGAENFDPARYDVEVETSLAGGGATKPQV